MTSSSCYWSWNVRVGEQHTLGAWQLHSNALQDARGHEASNAWESLHETQGSFSTSLEVDASQQGLCMRALKVRARLADAFMHPCMSLGLVREQDKIG